MNIVINSVKKHVAVVTLSYEEVVVLTRGRVIAEQTKSFLYTITWSAGENGGSLAPGQSVTVQDGMIFNVVGTSRA